MKWQMDNTTISCGCKCLVVYSKKEEEPKMKSNRLSNSNFRWKKDKMLLRLFDPDVKQKLSPVLIFVHRGGWSVGSVNTYDNSIKRLANSSGLIVAAMVID
jgi:acetyl esterase/lipase